MGTSPGAPRRAGLRDFLDRAEGLIYRRFMERSSGSSDEPERQSVQSVERSVRMLKAFTTATPELGLTQLAAAVGLSKGTTYRIAGTLIDGGLLEQDATSKSYRLGIGVLALAEVARSGLELSTKAHPHLEQLRNQFGETVYLLLNRDERVVCAERLEGTQRMRDLSTPPGSSVPYTRGAGGAAMLAAMPADEVRRILGPDASDVVAQRVSKAREQGYAFAEGDISEGVGAIAVALTDRAGRVVGAISLGGLLPRVVASEEEIAAAMIAAAGAISTDMGWSLG